MQQFPHICSWEEDFGCFCRLSKWKRTYKLPTIWASYANPAVVAEIFTDTRHLFAGSAALEEREQLVPKPAEEELPQCSRKCPNVNCATSFWALVSAVYGICKQAVQLTPVSWAVKLICWMCCLVVFAEKTKLKRCWNSSWLAIVILNPLLKSIMYSYVSLIGAWKNTAYERYLCYI